MAGGETDLEEGCEIKLIVGGKKISLKYAQELKK